MSERHLGSAIQAMVPELRPAGRHSAGWLGVTGTMGILRAALPFVRSLFLAAVVTGLIMVGLPAVLALGAAVR